MSQGATLRLTCRKRSNGRMGKESPHSILPGHTFHNTCYGSPVDRSFDAYPGKEIDRRSGITKNGPTKRPSSCQRTRYGVTTLPRAIGSDKLSKSKQKNMSKSMTLVLGGIEVCPYRTRFQTPLGIISYTVARSYFARSYLVSHTKKAILYGPLELGGASFRPLYMQQGIGQTTRSSFVTGGRILL
jgi:hypothetical protein